MRRTRELWLDLETIGKPYQDQAFSQLGDAVEARVKDCAARPIAEPLQAATDLLAYVVAAEIENIGHVFNDDRQGLGAREK